MDVSNLISSNNVTIDVVKKSPTKQIVLISPGAMKQIENKERINFLVEIDGQQKGYMPNKMSLKNMAEAWGNESKLWTGKIAHLEIGIVNGKEAVIAQPKIVQQVVA